ncbi:MAG TPA: hypothetical protein VHY48_08435 [Acidobacteriaceae bacterium]|jgi:hypothetical protein|nr:hypothetical protein [Acidobacteriaceae bacterium]
MAWLYDDAFYYLITAKHFSEQHIASFDGVTVTSGYHPLWMWLCSLVYGAHGRLDFFYIRCCMGMSLFISGTVLCLVLRHAMVTRNEGLLWALGLGTTSYSALNNGASVMEWPLVLLFWLLLHFLVGRRTISGSPQPSEGSMYIATFVVGFLGSLSRTDFGLIPVCYLIAGIVIAARGEGWARGRRAAAALVGAAAGVAAVFVYNRHMTGAGLQTSAEVKRVYASLIVPFNPVAALWQFLRVLLYLPPINGNSKERMILTHAGLRAIEVVAICAAVFIVARRRWLRSAVMRAAAGAGNLMLLAPVLGVGGYLLLYGFDSEATYGWYTATVTGFVLVLAARFFGGIRRPVAAAIVAPLMICNIAAAEYFGGNAKAQTQEIAAGQRMHREHPGAIMGGGDVGKPSFYNDGTMINLDGLMNNEVYPYLITGRIQCYVLDRHIAYLSDIGSITQPMVDAERAKRHEPPMPWSRYFIAVDPDPHVRISDGYLKTDFDAIRASKECDSGR